jgi:quinohemoprotein ethanol dehydrogenase
VAQKERWHADDGGAGFNQGGTLATAGNLVFAGVRSNLRVYRADTGQKLLDVDTHLTMLGPPMTFMLDGKQYVTFQGGQGAAGTGFGGGGASPVTPKLLTFVLDGKAPLPPPVQ